MPGNVALAQPATVMPASLSRAFRHAREYLVLENGYRNGESHRGLLTATSRKSWVCDKRLTPAQLQALRDFYDARKGPAEPFYFYDPYETNPRFTHDPSGQATPGRYTVRFGGEWSQSVGLGRVEVQIELVELA